MCPLNRLICRVFEDLPTTVCPLRTSLYQPGCSMLRPARKTTKGVLPEPSCPSPRRRTSALTAKTIRGRVLAPCRRYRRFWSRADPLLSSPNTTLRCPLLYVFRITEDREPGGFRDGQGTPGQSSGGCKKRKGRGFPNGAGTAEHTMNVFRARLRTAAIS